MQQGSQIQLGAIGPQDAAIYDMCVGGISAPFTKQCVRRHARFAIETKAEPFADGFFLGKTNVVNIPRVGDLLGDVFLEITLPIVAGAQSSDTWLSNIGQILLKRVKLIIDDVIIQSIERLWYDLEDQLFLKSSKRAGMDIMLGRGENLRMDRAHVILVPLKLFCCKGHRQDQSFMPLLGIPGSTMSISIDAESFGNLTESSELGPVVTVHANVLLDYVSLDAPEKERLLRRPTALMFEDTQDVEAMSFVEANDGNGGGRIPLEIVKVDMREINSPVKLLTAVSYLLTDAANKSYFNYRADIASASITINGAELLDERPADYFKIIETYYYVDNASASSNIHVYSFALDASSSQPCGHMNFDLAPSPEFRVRLSEKRNDVMVKVFVTCYKHIIFDKGRAMLKFI